MPPKEFSDRERQLARRWLVAAECFKDIRHTMPFQYVTTFMMIALDEGKTVGEYATQAGVSPSVMSRHILDLGIKTRSREPGLDLLVTKPNLMNLREHSVFLSEKGRTLFHKITRRMEG